MTARVARTSPRPLFAEGGLPHNRMQQTAIRIGEAET